MRAWAGGRAGTCGRGRAGAVLAQVLARVRACGCGCGCVRAAGGDPTAEDESAAAAAAGAANPYANPICGCSGSRGAQASAAAGGADAAE